MTLSADALYLLLKGNFALRYLLATLMMSWSMHKKEHFTIRLVVRTLFTLSASVAFPIIVDSLPYMCFVFTVIFLLSTLTVPICFSAPWQTVCYIGSAVLCAEHIASMADSLMTLLFPQTLDFFATHVLSLPVILNWSVSLIIVYAIVYLTLFRGGKLHREHNLNLHVMVEILLVSLFVNLYLNQLYTILIAQRSSLVMLFEYLLNILCSVFLLQIQSGILKESQARKSLEAVSFLWEHAREQYEISHENITAINQKCHDLKHLLMAVRSVIDPEEYNSMMETINSYGAEIKTNNEVLDVVFQEKNFQCRKLGIQFTCIIDGTAVAFMETTDLYVLFGNLLDNCIEAVTKLPPEEVKNIQVTVRKDRSFAVITTENGYMGELHWSGGRLRTSKGDKNNHGFGMLGMENIVHKYGGRYSISTDHQIFSMNIVFPITP
ncbi:MAG: sensor histidine kinase [Clostridia bacterium]|nr:sensor histidine kinase [Clostridia bacterium]